MSPREKRPSRAPTTPVITLLTDFGGRDGFVGIMKGVLLDHCPRARLVDLSHDIPPQDVLGGALVLASAVSWFPRGAVHLAVVDPGVGGERRPIAVETPGFTLVGPDNGLLSLAAPAAAKRRIIHLDRPETFLPGAGRTFHGRDVFAPVAARIAAGTTASALGSTVPDMEEISLPSPRRIDGVLEGQVIYVDRFGNLITNLGRADLDVFRPERVSVSIHDVQIAGISTHYSAVQKGAPVALWNSWERLEIAVRNGSAARAFRSRAGDRVEVRGRERSR